MAVFEKWFKQDLLEPIKIHSVGDLVFTEDNLSNVVGVELFRGGKTANISGSVACNVIRADGRTVVVTGELSGNKVSVTLPKAAMSVPGKVGVMLQLVTGEVKTTVLKVVLFSNQEMTDTVVDPEHIVPDISDVIAQMAAMEAATEAAQEAADELNSGMADIIKIQDTEPIEEYNKVWFDTSTETEITVPEYSEFEELANDVAELQNGGYIADAQQIQQKIDNYLDDHPEATTTVQDGSLTEAKFSNALKYSTVNDYVTPEMFGAKGDCVVDEYGLYVSGTDDTDAINAALQYPVVHFDAKKYYFTDTIETGNSKLCGAGIDKTFLVTDQAIECAISVNGASGGIEGFTLQCSGEAVNGIEVDGGLTAKPGQFVRSVRINRANGIGLYYKNGWQSEIHDIYTGNCVVGIRFDGADVSAHNLNISGQPSRNDLKQGLFINAGTVKIDNVKIDQYGCTLEEPYYPLYVLGQRNQLSNIEVQECGTFGAYIDGSYQTVKGLLIDKIGDRTVSVEGGNALRLGTSLDNSTIDAVIRMTQDTTDIVSVGNFVHGSNFSPDYYAVPAYMKNNVVRVVSNTDCIFSDLAPSDMHVLDYSLEEWKNIGAIRNLAADGTASDFRLEIKPTNFSNIDFTEIKYLALEFRYISSQSLNTFSFYGDNGSIITKRGQLIFNAANLRYTSEVNIPTTGFTIQVTATSGNTFKPTWIKLYLYKKDGRKYYRYYI